MNSTRIRIFVKIGLDLLIFACLLLIFACPVRAVSSVSSDNYTIDWPNLNMGAGLPSAEGKYKLGVTTGQTAPGFYEYTDGYRVRAGFQYIHTIVPFYFAISDISIAFGTLIVGTPSTRTNTLTVSAGGAGGYQVTALESKPLTSSAGAPISDTNCDTGDTCDEDDSGTWSSDTTYGFGYNMSGDDVPAAFNDGKYKRFPAASQTETARIVMSRSSVTEDYPTNAWPWRKQSTVTYKINVSNIQAAGTYRNMITFVATPSF